MDRAPDIGRMSGGQSLLIFATKGTAERTVFRIFRRKVEDTTGCFRRLGSVEPAAERARELRPSVLQVIFVRRYC